MHRCNLRLEVLYLRYPKRCNISPSPRGNRKAVHMDAVRPSAVISPTIGEPSRRRLKVLFALVALAALGSALIGLWHGAGQLGRPFGGFAWVRGYRDLYWVYPTTPHGWPGIDAGLRHLDVILSAGGQPPTALAQVFAAHVGEQVTYTLERAGRVLQVAAPVSTFSPGMYWELYGAFVLAGLSAVVAAQVLLRSTHERAFILMAAFLLVCGAIELDQANLPRIGDPYPVSLLSDLIWAFGYPLAGALMWHFTLVFPRPRNVLLRLPWPLRALYALAAVLGALYALSDPPILLIRNLGPAIFPVVLAFALSGLLASLVGEVLAYRSAALAEDSLASYSVRRLAVAWILGVLLYSYIGFGLDYVTNPLTILNDTIFSMAIIYPILLVYALLNVQVVEQLRRHLSEEQAISTELSELRRTRDHVLNEIADDLHTYVLPDIRGLQMSAEAAIHYGKPLDSQYASQTLESVYRVARRIMEGAKPVDLAEDELLPSVRRALDGLAAAVPDLAVHLEAENWDENFSLAVKEGLFRILQTAVTNVRDYAGARNLYVTLSKDDECVYATVHDDGHGFDVTRARRAETGDRRRHLGLRTMRAHAEALGGETLIESSAGGTQVTVTLPLALPPAGDGAG
jgi:signal transduction histidine kinase